MMKIFFFRMCSNIDVNCEEIYATGAEAVTMNVSVWYLHVPEIHNYYKIKSSEIFSSQRKKKKVKDQALLLLK